jgi:DNA-binding MarR family transcriptional regulator
VVSSLARGTALEDGAQALKGARIHEAIGHLGRLSDLFQKRRVQLAESVGLTEHQWGVLEEVALDHFMPSMFARQRESSAAAVSKTLRQLLSKELIAVSVDANDGRQRKYELTTSGKQVLERLRHYRQEAIRRVWENLDEGELERFCTFARVLGDGLEELSSSGTSSLHPVPSESER